MQGRESTASVFQRQRTGATGAYPASPDFTWKCHVVPISEQLQLREDLVQSTHYLLGEYAAISEGDRIEVDSEVFFVRGVQILRTPLKNPHHIQVYVTERK